MNQENTKTENIKKNNKVRRTRRNNEKSIRWEQRLVQIQRVTKVVKGGKNLSFRAIIVIGNQKSEVGVGVAKAAEISIAVKKALHNAKKHIIKIPLTKTDSIPHATTGIDGASKIMIKPAAPGTGVIAGSSIRVVLELAGLQNILAKQLGSSNLLNNARATINALESLKTAKQVASERNIPLEQLYDIT